MSSEWHGICKKQLISGLHLQATCPLMGARHASASRPKTQQRRWIMRGRIDRSGFPILFVATALIFAAASKQAIGDPASYRGGGGDAAESDAARLLAEPLRLPPVDPTVWQKAYITVLLPDANAQVLIDGNRMTSTGIIRRFISPPLDPGRYTYEIRASWTDRTPVTQFRTVMVSPGSQSVVDFRPHQQ